MSEKKASKKTKNIIILIVSIVVIVAVVVGFAFAFKDEENGYVDTPVIGITAASTTENNESSNVQNESQSSNQDETSSSTKQDKNNGKTTTEKTTVKSKPRYLDITIALPQGSSIEDTLEIYINGELVKTEQVLVDGKIYTFKTEEKYKGDVSVDVRLVAYNTSTGAVISAQNNAKKLILPLNGTEDNIVEDE